MSLRLDKASLEWARRQVVLDPSFWMIVAGNVFSIVMAVRQDWDLGEVMGVYWMQSVLIGAVNFWRIWTLREFSTDGILMNGQPLPETVQAKRQVACFFALHYGFFHAVYMVFIISLFGVATEIPGNIGGIGLCVAGFAAAHGFSFRYNRLRDFRERKPNLGKVMAYPYLRIVPMHITVLTGGIMGTAGILIFMVLKTLADAGMHVFEHHLFRRGDPGAGN